MNYLQVIVTMNIHDGKMDEFKKLAAACMAVVKEKDKGTLQYDWYLNEDQKVCTVIEKQKDSDALLAHVGNLGDLFGQLLAIVDFYPALYGNPSETLLQATAALKPQVHSSLQRL